jgi:bifunctional DNA-binding transcriptional regulator/antitoxin component of YhaV-PrlF toxin-antitoxin module
MKVKIKKLEGGEHYFNLPEKLQKELGWEEGDTIEWVDNQDGSFSLSKASEFEALKSKIQL